MPQMEVSNLIKQKRAEWNETWPRPEPEMAELCKYDGHYTDLWKCSGGICVQNTNSVRCVFMCTGKGLTARRARKLLRLITRESVQNHTTVQHEHNGCYFLSQTTSGASRLDETES